VSSELVALAAFVLPFFSQPSYNVNSSNASKKFIFRHSKLVY